MKEHNMNKLLSIFILCSFILQIVAHSYVTNPQSRGNQAQTESGCVLPSCAGPCERPASQAGAGYPTSRGASLMINWPRNNHPGGFIRFAWAPTAQSDTMANFDANVDQYRCFESPPSSCHPGNPNDPNGADAAGTPQTCCGATITVPGWVTDGKWTLQWAWFGGGYFLGDYYGCVDYAVSGGTTTAHGNPLFYGGDYSNQNNTANCKYFNTNKLHVCGADGCVNSVTDGASVNGAPANVQVGVSSGAQTGVVSGTVSGGTTNQTIACNSDTMCPTGICQSNGYCYVKGLKKLDGGGIAAIVFALIFVVVVALTVMFIVINKSEWSNWKPFNKAKSGSVGGGGFSS